MIDEGYTYSVGDHDEGSRFDFPKRTSRDGGPISLVMWHAHDIRGLAEDLAEDYFSEHDGWENANGPWDMRIWSPTGELMGAVEIEIEPVPSFTAREIPFGPEVR